MTGFLPNVLPTLRAVVGNAAPGIPVSAAVRTPEEQQRLENIRHNNHRSRPQQPSNTMDGDDTAEITCTMDQKEMEALIGELDRLCEKFPDRT